MTKIIHDVHARVAEISAKHFCVSDVDDGVVVSVHDPRFSSVLSREFIIFESIEKGSSEEKEVRLHVHDGREGGEEKDFLATTQSLVFESAYHGAVTS